MSEFIGSPDNLKETIEKDQNIRIIEELIEKNEIKYYDEAVRGLYKDIGNNFINSIIIFNQILEDESIKHQFVIEYHKDLETKLINIKDLRNNNLQNNEIKLLSHLTQASYISKDENYITTPEERGNSTLRIIDLAESNNILDLINSKEDHLLQIYEDYDKYNKGEEPDIPNSISLGINNEGVEFIDITYHDKSKVTCPIYNIGYHEDIPDNQVSTIQHSLEAINTIEKLRLNDQNI